MKRTISLMITPVLICIAAGIQGQDNLTGEQIAQRVHDANKSASGLVVKGTLTMKNMASGASDSRSAVLITVRQNGQNRALIRFTSSSYSGTTMLTIERESKENLQYLYLPSVGSPRQIEGSDREKNFVDTDFSNEDLGGSRIADYRYNRLPDRNIAGNDCWVIERMPKSSSSKYSKHVVVIDKATLIPLNVQFYARSGRLVKTMKAAQIKRIGSVNLPMYLEVTDIENRRQSSLNVADAREKKVNAGYFNRNRMNVKWAEQ
ncbi:MAG: outer membrane lipoprotein-sorting protein [Spirochaetes bacterium]|nr:outer membrane lipoprotein-sorting protein [Spirochaetota bacterium]